MISASYSRFFLFSWWERMKKCILQSHRHISGQCAKPDWRASWRIAMNHRTHCPSSMAHMWVSYGLPTVLITLSSQIDYSSTIELPWTPYSSTPFIESSNNSKLLILSLWTILDLEWIEIKLQAIAPATYGTMEIANRLFLSALLQFGASAFPEFAAFDGKHRVSVPFISELHRTILIMCGNHDHACLPSLLWSFTEFWQPYLWYGPRVYQNPGCIPINVPSTCLINVNFSGRSLRISSRNTACSSPATELIALSRQIWPSENYD